MIFDILEHKLEQSGLFKPGIDLFRNQFPADVKRGLLLRGPLTGIPINPDMEGFFKVDIQLILRHSKASEGMELANEVSRALITERETRYDLPVGSGLLKLFYPKTRPIQFPRLEGNGLEFSQDYFAAWSERPSWR